jgi:hypothetical protein
MNILGIPRERMMTAKKKRRLIYVAVFFLILTVEVLIALYVRDDFIRPYGGDILVTVLLCCFVRILFPAGIRLLPLWIFLFSCAVEIGQYFDYAAILGFAEDGFMRILLGSSFSVWDLLCYGAGCVLFALAEYLLCTRLKKASRKG